MNTLDADNARLVQLEEQSRVLHRICCLGAALLFGVLYGHSSFAADDTRLEKIETSEAQPLPSSVSLKPKWEFGIGGGYSLGYDYPASSDTNRRAIALPFLIYRSPLFRFGGGGVRAVAIERPRIKLDLSVGGSLNASSQGNSVRQDMPDLDFLFEVGPQLAVRLFDRRLDSGVRLRGQFSSKLRAVFSTDFRGLDSRGVVADIGVGISASEIADSGVTFFSRLDTSFATEPLHDYFYEVDPEFVTEKRPAYDASGGYLESNLFVGIAYRPMRQVRLFVGVIKGFYSSASNEDSPLFETREQTRYALGFVWTIKTSKTMIDVVDLGGSE